MGVVAGASPVKWIVVMTIRVSPSPEEVKDFCVQTIPASIVEFASKVFTIGREEQITMVEHELINWWVLW